MVGTYIDRGVGGIGKVGTLTVRIAEHCPFEITPSKIGFDKTSVAKIDLFGAALFHYQPFYIQTEKVAVIEDTLTKTDRIGIQQTLPIRHRPVDPNHLARDEIDIYVNEVKGMSALKLSRELDIQYKTAFVLLHKFREALLETRDNTPLNGVCEIDGAYVNHYVRPANNVNDRIDRRLAVNQNPNKRCIVVVRQRANEATEYIGSVRTLTYVLHNENPTGIAQIANTAIVRGATVHADEANAYDNLHATYDMQRVNHSVEYMSEEGACSNQAESFFARFRRFQQGQIHRMGQLYISNYANEIAYREDTRRMSNGDIFRDISKKCMKTIQSNEWTGYWQGNHRISERLGVA